MWMITPFRVRVAAAVTGGPHRPPPGSRRGRPPRRSDVLAAFDAHRPQPSPRTDRNQCGRSPRSTTSRRGHVALTTRTARRADVREPAAGRVAGRLSDGRVSHSAGCRTGFATDQRERGRRSVPMQRGDSAACCSRNGTGLGPTWLYSLSRASSWALCRPWTRIAPPRSRPSFWAAAEASCPPLEVERAVQARLSPFRHRPSVQSGTAENGWRIHAPECTKGTVDHRKNVRFGP